MVLSPTLTVGATGEEVHTYLPIVAHTDWSCPYLDDFSNPASGWPIVDDELWSAGYTSGEYRIHANYVPAGYISIGYVSNGGATQPVAVEVDVRQASIANGALGIVYGLNGDGSRFYTFQIYPATREYAVLRYYPGERGLRRSVLRHGTSGAINSGHGGSRLRVTWQAGSLSFEVNGQRVSSLAASKPVAGYVGLVAETARTGFDVRFDNFEVVPVGCPDYTAAAPAPGMLRSSLETTWPWGE